MSIFDTFNSMIGLPPENSRPIVDMKKNAQMAYLSKNSVCSKENKMDIMDLVFKRYKDSRHFTAEGIFKDGVQFYLHWFPDKKQLYRLGINGDFLFRLFTGFNKFEDFHSFEELSNRFEDIQMTQKLTKLKSLEEHNKEIIERREKSRKGNGIACPECGCELYDVIEKNTLSGVQTIGIIGFPNYPPKQIECRNVKCKYEVTKY